MPKHNDPDSGDADDRTLPLRGKQEGAPEFRKEGNAERSIGEALASLPDKQRPEIEELMNQGAARVVQPDIDPALQNAVPHELLNPLSSRIDELLERVEELERRVAKLEDTQPRQ